MTKHEKLLWEQIQGKKLGAYFQPQVDVGPYRLDFYTRKAKLCVEVDGHGHRHQREYDADRDGWLWNRRGIWTIRLSNQMVEFDMPFSLNIIANQLNINPKMRWVKHHEGQTREGYDPRLRTAKRESYIGDVQGQRAGKGMAEGEGRLASIGISGSFSAKRHRGMHH